MSNWHHSSDWEAWDKKENIEGNENGIWWLNTICVDFQKYTQHQWMCIVSFARKKISSYTHCYKVKWQNNLWLTFRLLSKVDIHVENKKYTILYHTWEFLCFLSWKSCDMNVMVMVIASIEIWHFLENFSEPDFAVAWFPSFLDLKP